MARNVIIHDINLTGANEPNEPASFTVRVEPGETVAAIRQKVADLARGGRINEILHFVFAGRQLEDEEVIPADATYLAVKFATPERSNQTGGRRRRSTRRRRISKRGGSKRSGSRRVKRRSSQRKH